MQIAVIKKGESGTWIRPDNGNDQGSKIAINEIISTVDGARCCDSSKADCELVALCECGSINTKDKLISCSKNDFQYK